MLFNSYTSVSRLINTEPSELLRLRLSEPIASESEMSSVSFFCINFVKSVVSEVIGIPGTCGPSIL